MPGPGHSGSACAFRHSTAAVSSFRFRNVGGLTARGWRFEVGTRRRRLHGNFRRKLNRTRNGTTQFRRHRFQICSVHLDHHPIAARFRSMFTVNKVLTLLHCIVLLQECKQ